MFLTRRYNFSQFFVFRPSDVLMFQLAERTCNYAGVTGKWIFSEVFKSGLCVFIRTAYLSIGIDDNCHWFNVKGNIYIMVSYVYHQIWIQSCMFERYISLVNWPFCAENHGRPQYFRHTIIIKQTRSHCLSEFSTFWHIFKYHLRYNVIGKFGSKCDSDGTILSHITVE